MMARTPPWWPFLPRRTWAHAGKPSHFRAPFPRRTFRAHASNSASAVGGGLSGASGGLASLEETILQSEVIARVGYLREQSSVVRVESAWAVLLEFRFEVHEYLKGSGPDEIGTIAYYYTRSEPHAEEVKTLLPAAHDTRWDDREAIVFLNYRAEHTAPAVELGAGQFWLEYAGAAWDGFLDWYSVASDARKLWLPEATQATRGTRAGNYACGEQ